MPHHVLFIQGGGGKEDHAADAKLVDSLRESLGSDYEVHYPLLPEDAFPDFGRCKQIGEEISLIKDDIILVGHSLGASMLLKYVSENEIKHKIVGMFLISTPFWSGDDVWKEGLKLQEDFHSKLPKDVPVFLYHCRDDGEVPFEHLSQYEEKLPEATVCEVEKGGHQFNNNLSVVAMDIKSLIH